jgi:hypothetical protein
MGFAARFFPNSKAGLDAVDERNSSGSGTEAVEEKKDPVDAPNTEVYSSDGESVRSGYDGVKKAQATTIVWTRKSLVIAYAMYAIQSYNV